MVIAGNNLAEKLFGHAISREHLQRSTAFCALLEDPAFELDIDLAVDLHAALNGNAAAATRLVNTLVLNSNTCLDQSTIGFYVDKMRNNSLFQSHIDRITTIFNDPNYPNFTIDDDDGPDAGFLNQLKNAARDCVNEPCNIFAAISDSIGRSAQASSTKTNENVFALGALKDTAVNIINGVDETIFNNIPGAFQKGIVEVTSIAQNALTETQAILAGKANINKLVGRASRSGSMRDTTETMYPYTPDFKSFMEYTQASPGIISDIASNLGGCFNKYQHVFRYNPYRDNDSTPELPSISQVNGGSYLTDPGGNFNNAGHTPETIGDCSAVGSGVPNIAYGGGAAGETSVNSGDVRARNATVTYARGEAYEDEGVWLSRPMILGSKSTSSEGYSVFGGFIDYDDKIILVDNYTSKSKGGTADDDNTMSGTVFTNNMLICPSYWVDAGDINGGSREVARGAKLADRGYIINKLSNGYTHNVTEEGMALLQNSKSSKTFDDGVALSIKTLKALGVLSKLNNNKLEWTLAATRNEAFAILRRANECPKIIKIVDVNYQNQYNVDLTPAAYKFLFDKNPIGKPINDQNALFSEPGSEYKGWRAAIAEHKNDGQIEVSVALGSYEAVKAAVEREYRQCGDIRVSDNNWRDYFELESTVLVPGNIGSYGTKAEKEERAIDKLDPKLVDALINISKTVGKRLSVTSAYRSKMVNEKVKGKKNSQHLVGKAADVIMSGIDRQQFVEAAGKAGINGIGFYDTFIHVDVRGNKAKWGPYDRYATTLRKYGWSA